jgi:hypothetical protein
MSDCPIFKTFSAVEKIWTEIDNLVEEFSTSLKIESKETVTFSMGNCLDGSQAEEIETPVSNCWFEGTVKIRSKGRGPARSRPLTLYFDLSRALTEGLEPWSFASQALLLIGFYPHSEASWGEYCAPNCDGTLKEKEIWEDCRQHAYAGNRLLNCSEHDKSDDDWSHRAWMFGTPLREIVNSEAVANFLAKPVSSLLTGSDPTAALASAKAVPWNIAGVVERQERAPRRLSRPADTPRRK